MKGATQCARRVRQLFRGLRAKLGKVSRPPTGDPITQMILGVLSRDVPEAKAREALDQMKSMVVDYNELRVIPALELANAIGDYPDARIKCEDLSRALNRVFAIEHSVSLDRIGSASKTDVTNYLNGIPGLDGYSRARVKLLGLGHHAIPLDEAMWALARREGIIDDKCPLEEAQAFLERQIDEADAIEFVSLLRKAAWAEMGAAVRRGEVEKIRSIPPDRTTRNMLQLIAFGGAADVAADATGAGPEGLEALDEDAAASVAEVARPAVKSKKPSDGRSGRRPARSSGTKSGRKTGVKPSRRSASRARTA